MAGPAYELGLCAGAWRVMAGWRPIAVDMPEGIDIFTDPARLRGAGLGIRVMAGGGRRFGLLGLKAEAGLGVEATRLHLTSSFIDLEARDLALVVPLRLGADLPLGPGRIGLWAEASWTAGASGAMAGLSYVLTY